MDITPDSIILFKYGIIKLNATILITWMVMFILVVGSWLITRKIVKGKLSANIETIMEIIVKFIYKHLQEIGIQKPEKHIGFIGTLFIFIGFCGILTIVPGYIPPTGSLSTTAALAICVFIAVPLYAIKEKGVIGFLKNYLHPFFIFLPFNIIADITRTLALAIRLFGNTMSGTLIMGIMISVAPFFFPVFFKVLELITSLVQAYIFTVLATVYIAAATRTFEKNRVKGE